ncbi:hypothetical protein PV10_08113 [Exophiala mesophila]|uniref:Mid2 domain-containing protein n=1 Tax=Exophiala mesophila TaxID=212818 RepID=A0A0D1ZNS7_EXOME|nr:uncharacterized protein PV10_08113 [Exophiala mesophila]KIV88428.1 hypothetical protein PV10_08113 [Exophiala mesophila]
MPSNLNQDISSGLCFRDVEDRASDGFIPCGNAALGHKSCCQAFDVCLSSNACYNGEYGVTYIAGCTDIDYEDDRCPDKPEDYEDESWVGLVYCNGSSNAWSWCINGPDAITTPKPCWCPREDTESHIAFHAGSVLDNIMILPRSTGMSVYWVDMDEYEEQLGIAISMSREAESSMSTKGSVSTKTETKTYTIAQASDGTWKFVTRTTVWTDLSGESTTSSASTATSATEASDTSIPASQTTDSSAQATLASEGGLSKSSIGGIAAGAGAGFLIICLLVGWLFYRYRLRNRDEGHDQDGFKSPSPEVSKSNGPSSFSVIRPHPVTTATTTTTTLHDDDEMRSPAWSGHKPELPANESFAMSNMTSYKPYRPQSSTTASYQACSVPGSSDDVEGDGSPFPVSPPPARPAQDGSLHRVGQSGRYYEMAG